MFNEWWKKSFYKKSNFNYIEWKLKLLKFLMNLLKNNVKLIYKNIK